ncbi:MAG: hypothetical protein RLZZ546_537, partial [Bacteroidota bacterium]
FPILVIDINSMDFISQSHQYKAIKDLLKKEYRPGVHRVSLIMD